MKFVKLMIPILATLLIASACSAGEKLMQTEELSYLSDWSPDGTLHVESLEKEQNYLRCKSQEMYKVINCYYADSLEEGIKSLPFTLEGTNLLKIAEPKQPEIQVEELVKSNKATLYMKGYDVYFEELDEKVQLFYNISNDQEYGDRFMDEISVFDKQYFDLKVGDIDVLATELGAFYNAFSFKTKNAQHDELNFTISLFLNDEVKEKMSDSDYEKIIKKIVHTTVSN